MVVYEVRPGDAARVASVRIDADVSDVEWPRLATIPGRPLRDADAEEDSRRIARALEDAGHASPRVEVVAPDGGGEVPVVFRVQAGTRTMVASVKVDTPVELPADAPARELSVRPGVAYRIRDVARDRNALLTAYRDAGYAQADVTPEATLSEDRRQARVVLRVLPGPRLSVDHIVVAGEYTGVNLTDGGQPFLHQAAVTCPAVAVVHKGVGDNQGQCIATDRDGDGEVGSSWRTLRLHVAPIRSSAVSWPVRASGRLVRFATAMFGGQTRPRR